MTVTATARRVLAATAVTGASIVALGGGLGTAAASAAPTATAPTAGTSTSVASVDSVQSINYTCKTGYVWREARSSDLVCVTPQTRTQTKADNAQAPYRVDPNAGWGPNGCKSGFVWREAYYGDVVCVTPYTRDQARYDNQMAPYRRLG
jgi:hypothetical protein